MDRQHCILKNLADTLGAAENGFGQPNGLAIWATEIYCELADTLQSIQNGVGQSCRATHENAVETLKELRETYNYPILMKFTYYLQVIVQLSNDLTLIESNIKELNDENK